jgi:hypothetical protein
MYFDPNNDLNEEMTDAIKAMADELLFAEGGALDEAAGTWVTRKMLFAPSDSVHDVEDEPEDSGFSLTDDGYDVETVETVEDFLNEGDRDKNWKRIESISTDTQKQWVINLLKQIINGEHEIDAEIRKYISGIADQDKLAVYIEGGLDNFGAKRKAWMDEFIQQSIMILIMQYRDAASSTQATYQEKENKEQEFRQKAGDSSGKVMAACDALGGMRAHYGIDECDDILDLLEGIVNGEDITDDDVARFVQVNAARFDEDVLYLLTTRFPILEPEA